MRLLIVYIVLVVIGETIAVNLGLYLDTALPSAGLAIALALFFTVLVAMWPIASLIYDRVLTPKTA